MGTGTTTGSNIEIELGSTYIDEITKFKGVATAVTYHLGGNVRVVLEGPLGDARNSAAGDYFDAFRLRLVDQQEDLDLTAFPSDARVTHTDAMTGSRR